MKCILHIGTEKTATTLLQDWLYSNRYALGKQGIYLPTSVGFPNNRLLPAYFRESLDDWCRAEKIRSLDEKAAYFKGFEAEFSKEIERACETHHVAVLTSEHFHSRVTKIQEIQKLKNFLYQNFSSVSIVCYFRNQADMAVSLYSTALKAAEHCSLEQFLENVEPENYYYNFLEIANQWSDVFGYENCVFRIYDRSQFFKGDIRRDFLALFAPDAEIVGLDFSIQSANESLTRLSAAAFRSVNEHVPYWDAQGHGIDASNLRLKNALSQLDTLKTGPRHLVMKKELLQKFEATNSEFFKRYFKTTDLFAGAAQKEPSEQSIGIDQVEKILREVISVVLQQTKSLPTEGSSMLVDRDADALRDIALKIESGAVLTLADALSLMLFAHRARPTGGLINKKIADYRAKL